MQGAGGRGAAKDGCETSKAEAGADKDDCETSETEADKEGCETSKTKAAKDGCETDREKTDITHNKRREDALIIKTDAEKL